MVRAVLSAVFAAAFLAWLVYSWIRWGRRRFGRWW